MEQQVSCGVGAEVDDEEFAEYVGELIVTGLRFISAMLIVGIFLELLW